MNQKFYYLLRLEYLGFRYHGWQVQPGVKTAQYMLDRTLNYIYSDIPFKTLAASRTDAMVSVQDQLIQLSLGKEVALNELKEKLNKNLPADIRLKEVSNITKEFNVISCPKVKEYHYYFSFGEKAHPYSAPFIVNYQESLDINQMIRTAKLFEGNHNFKEYCYRPNEKKTFEREILESKIVKNNFLTANFFPDNSYAFIVKGSGFLHHQVRIMMGALIKVGLGELNNNDILSSFQGKGEYPIGFIAPASGLHLYSNKLS